ncbi:ragulator complex protein LAMTOR4 homolog [Scaptodrosophila lebanonensis]|uniref:Late endosomal/lysosomal adaptor and MAPK and MTOR activator 4 n=1 Tax=Drosophila lebanonensis TaxID=7225 RepID=A0A6J2TU44_DROLE|nr:ragulator complex protein LAMTOR4 homolog [Scaptodrosophila lebanonensis]
MRAPVICQCYQMAIIVLVPCEYQIRTIVLSDAQAIEMEKLITPPNQIGHLILKDDGAVLESGGELKNDERSANVIMGLLNLTESIDENFMPNSSCERITIDYEEHSYSICLSNKRIYVVKLSKTHSGNGATTSSPSSTTYNDTEFVEGNNASSSTVLA